MIWIYTSCESRVYPGSAGQELSQIHADKSLLQESNKLKSITF